MRTLFTTLLFVVSLNSQAGDQQINISQQQLLNLGIKTGQLATIKHVPLLYAPAKVTIPPSQEFIVSAAQAGLISRLNAAIGDPVEKGQLLAIIKSPQLLTLQRQFLKANSDRHLAWLTYQRDKKLFQEGVISDRRWQQTRSQYNSNASTANEAKQLLEIAGMSDDDINRLAQSRRLNSQLNVRSPIQGVVLERRAVAGERLDILQPIYRIANLQQLWLEINIPQERINQIKLGDKVRVENSRVTATISLLGQSVNLQNQTVLARAVVDGHPEQIRAGQTINTQIIQSSDQVVYKVPNSAISQSKGQSYIFIRNEQGFKVQPVKVIGKQDSEAIISGEITGKEPIAIQGVVALKAKWLGLGEDE